MVLKRILFVVLLIVIAISCKSKSVATAGTAKGMSANKIIKNHYDTSLDKETVIARLKVKYKGKNNLPGVTASLRMEKDKTIWINLSKIGFPIGKVLITKDRVSYYEKINKTYFDGDFTLLSNWLGTDLDFKKVQNLLFGEAILNLKREKHLVDVKESNYQLSPKKPYELFDIFYFINSEHFKLDGQKIQQLNEKKQLTIDYSDYNRFDGELLPKKIFITAKDEKNVTTVDVEYRSIQFNKDVYFPFTIPEGYKEIKLK